MVQIVQHKSTTLKVSPVSYRNLVAGLEACVGEKSDPVPRIRCRVTTPTAGGCFCDHTGGGNWAIYRRERDRGPLCAEVFSDGRAGPLTSVVRTPEGNAIKCCYRQKSRTLWDFHPPNMTPKIFIVGRRCLGPYEGPTVGRQNAVLTKATKDQDLPTKPSTPHLDRAPTRTSCPLCPAAPSNLRRPPTDSSAAPQRAEPTGPLTVLDSHYRGYPQKR